MFGILIYLVYVIVPILLLLVGRIFYIALKKDGKLRMRKSQSVKTLVVLGSGGHTTEILQIVKNLKTENYTPRIYIHASSDKISFGKVHEIEKKDANFEIIEIPRSREVGQSYVSSVWTTLLSFGDCLKILRSYKPDLILCNGPGTCVPICVASFLTKLVFLRETTIIFVESFCRVKTFSLSGRILYYIADHVIVQWPPLCKNTKKHVNLIK